MKKILYIDCPSGISGDMTVGALLHLGVPMTHLEEKLSQLHVDGFQLALNKGQKNGITGMKFDVLLSSGEKADHCHEQEHEHEHGQGDHAHDHSGHHHDHAEHKHGHNHEHDGRHLHDHAAHIHAHAHHHRNLTDILHILENSGLSERVIELSRNMFQAVAEAEGKIHDKPLDQVHFHEVGALDSIVDIVGTAICIDYLQPDEIVVSPLHTGTGLVKCAHGRIPVPAPATLEILKGIPVYSTGVRSELVTPTGAAIAKVLADRYGNMPAMAIQSIGYGLGTKDLPMANVLRVVIGEA